MVNVVVLKLSIVIITKLVVGGSFPVLLVRLLNV